MKTEFTQRGFALFKFKDHYDNPCSLQKSSLAFEEDDAIWLGVDDPSPKIMATDAARMGIITNGQTTGWVPYYIPGEVNLSTRMHLTQTQVKELLPILQHFAEHGELPLLTG